MNEMSEFHVELLEIADHLERIVQRTESAEVKEPLKRLEEAATQIGKASSGSWFGYHARVYYKNLEPPPPGAHFSPEWGMMDTFVEETIGEWEEFDEDNVKRAIHELAENPDLNRSQQVTDEARKAFENDKPEVMSLLSTSISQQQDSFLSQLKEQVEKLTIYSRSDFVRGLQPSGQFMSRDSLAMTQGLHTPPHISVLCEVLALRQPVSACGQLAQLARKAGSHLSRQLRRARHSREIGTNVFIGHGRSLMWRELKDFIQDRLHLPWDEFNRVPVAGVTNIARLSEMLDAAAIAFLVMTAEDEQVDGKLHARMNVIHEAGLFQGRLGFTRAILLLEEECEEFSNIHGLGQIRFPKGNIKAAFDDVRQVLEREGLVER
jgi:predicted nucleotide-binding protein